MTSEEKYKYVLRIADSNLIYGQRLAEWCGHGPVLEEDIALANTSLDYMGQATLLFQYAAKCEGKGRDEDQIAFLRDATEYGNLLMLELPNGDYAFTIGRQFLFANFYWLFLEKLENSNDEFLAAFAAKAKKEVKYHVQHAADWILRMGDGTEESHQRIQKAIDELWEYTPEFFQVDALDNEALSNGVGVDLAALHTSWYKLVSETLTEATLKIPADGWGHNGGRQGRHTEYLGYVLADMQYLQRTYPGAKW
ncbi:MAG: 1,2-phenylacetyl-CoA epoxidase subunit PaaC [Flavobacteriales bacterium]